MTDPMTTSGPTILVDGDACPNTVKEALFKAANRASIPVVFIANHFIKVPPSPHITSIQVPQGFDVADSEIVLRAQAIDLVITSDIPLADEVIDKKATVINFKGEILTKENIKSRLNMRDFMDTLRSSGVNTGGSAPYSPKDKQSFSNALDRWIAKSSRNK